MTQGHLVDLGTEQYISLPGQKKLKTSKENKNILAT